MLRNFPTNRILSLTSECYPGAINSLNVRWARKPMWLPTAKSKLFRVPVKPKIPEIETEEIKRLFNKYRTEVKSLRQFLYNKHSVKLMAKADTAQIKKDFEEDFDRCSQVNNKWNEEVKAIREKRVAEELEKEIAFAKERLQHILMKTKANQVQAEEDVRQVKELAVNFITAENIDEAIELAINSPTEYNFAIDLDGNRLEGREPLVNKIVKQKASN